MNPANAHEELLILLRHIWEDIERTKQRQWRDIYHVLIAQGATLGLFVALDHKPLLFPCVFATAIVFLTAVGIAIVNNSQRTLVQRRGLVDECYKMLDDEKIKNLLDSPQAKSVGQTTYPKLYTALVIGSGIFAFAVIFGR